MAFELFFERHDAFQEVHPHHSLAHPIQRYERQAVEVATISFNRVCRVFITAV